VHAPSASCPGYPTCWSRARAVAIQAVTIANVASGARTVRIFA